jgi:hypothetical protein
VNPLFRIGRACRATGWIVLLLLTATSSPAEETELTVRVLAKGAKFVGTSMGGVRVTVRDVETGELLAEGTTAGTTGSTDKIMREPRTPHDPVSTEDAAAFRATLDLAEPRLVEVVAWGPLGQRQSANRVSATQWIVPGKHVSSGDAWLLVLPGFVVDVLGPPAHQKRGPEEPLFLRANVTMMCGCPVEPGGLWDAERFEVRAILERNGKPAGEIGLSYAGRTSQFEARIDDPAPGVYEATVYAYDPANGNTGLDRTSWIVSEPGS